jgi:hypothetical protein
MKKRLYVVAVFSLVLMFTLAACVIPGLPPIPAPMGAPAPQMVAPPTINMADWPMPEKLGDVIVQAAHDGNQIALRFTWVSTKEYAGQYHDFVQYTEGAWARLPSSIRINEDRLSLMIDNPIQPIPYFATMGCYVACHSDMNTMPNQPRNAEGAVIDTRHYVLAEEGADPAAYGLDMWHWRGGRSGPMGYAEDTWVATGLYETGAQGRQRDRASGPTNWIRSGGDRLYEDQNWGGDLLFWNDVMLPRFVFNPAKSGFNNYFLADANGVPFTDHMALMNTVTDITYVSNLIIYQDPGFDPIDKVNSIDVLYLLYVADAIDAPEYNNDWAGYWANQTGVTEAAQAEAMLGEIVATMQEGVLVTRSVNFLFESSQHDIPTARDFDYDSNTWSITMVRDLTTATAGVDDVDLMGLADGLEYPFAFAIHDLGGGGISHFVSFPYTLGIEGSEADVIVALVDGVGSTDWSELPFLQTVVYAPLPEYSFDTLLDSSFHSGARRLDSRSCQSCHVADFVEGILDD